MAWWATKVRQTVRHVTGRVGPADRAALAGWLDPAQLELFDGMHRADRRHGLDVVAVLRAAGHADRELLLAGLLHDCAKGPRTGLGHRVAWALAERYGPRAERMLARLPGYAAAFDRLRDHAERSAVLAGEAGCPERTVDLIRHQDGHGSDRGAIALRMADEAS